MLQTGCKFEVIVETYPDNLSLCGFRAARTFYEILKVLMLVLSARRWQPLWRWGVERKTAQREREKRE